MSYAQRKQLSGNPALATFFTVAVVGSLMYAIVTGLAYNVIKKTAENLKVIDVEQPPPPPKQPPPPPKDMPKVPPPPMTPPPLVRVEAPPPPIQTVTSPTPPPVYIPPVAPAPPAPPPPPRKTQSASPASGDVRSAFSNDDYPESAIAANAQGTARAQLTIGPDGRVTGCSLIQSTGNGALDATTCNILRRRVKFVPARDSNGNATSDTYTTPPIRWVLPEG
ncbi:MAG TPA: TonB family protein [Sphingomicrobium sp.]|jgi:periplasmic protein TonB